jgi:hypothetical protein
MEWVDCATDCVWVVTSGVRQDFRIVGNGVLLYQNVWIWPCSFSRPWRIEPYTRPLRRWMREYKQKPTLLIRPLN